MEVNSIMDLKNVGLFDTIFPMKSNGEDQIQKTSKMSLKIS